MFASSAWMAAAGLHAHDDAEASDLAQSWFLVTMLATPSTVMYPLCKQTHTHTHTTTGSNAPPTLFISSGVRIVALIL